jgi:hypothetical protein
MHIKKMETQIYIILETSRMHTSKRKEKINYRNEQQTTKGHTRTTKMFSKYNASKKLDVHL